MHGQQPPQGGYPPQQGGYPPQQGGYPPYYQQPPPQGGYPPQQGGYPPYPYPPQGGYPPQQGGYPPQQGGYPPQQGGYPPQQGGYPPQQGGYPPQQGGYPPQPYPPQGGGGAPPQQQQSGGWATWPRIDSFADWTWDNNGNSWNDRPHESHHYKFERTANPRYAVSSSWAVQSTCLVDVYDLDGEALVGHLNTEKPERGYMHDAEAWGDIVFSVGDENGCIARVYSINSTEQTGYWKGIGEKGMYNCTVIETPALTGVGGSFSGGEIRLFDINTCKPTGKISADYTNHPNYIFSNPVERNTFYIADASGKFHQYDARAKKKQRTLLASVRGFIGNVSFPASGGGKFVVSHTSDVDIIDSNTGKTLHTGSGAGYNHYAALESNMMVVGATNKIWLFDITKFNDKKIDFSQAEYDMASAQHVLGIGYGQGKIHVIGAGGWKTLSNPAVKK